MSACLCNANNNKHVRRVFLDSRNIRNIRTAGTPKDDDEQFVGRTKKTFVHCS